VTRTLIRAATEIATTVEKPVILTRVEQFAAESLETEADNLNSPALWVLNENRQPQIVGRISKTLRNLLKALEEQGAASAKQMATVSLEGNPSKKQVGNFSVYLSHLFKAGLVVREKIGSTDREDAERGWTFLYKSAISLTKS